MKNLEFAAVLPFAQQVQYQKGQVVSNCLLYTSKQHLKQNFK